MKLASIRLWSVLVLGAAGTAVAASDLRTLPVPELQRLFLACERQAAQGMLGGSDAAACSHTYEQLLRRGFDSDFKRLLAWWQSERATAVAAVASPP